MDNARNLGDEVALATSTKIGSMQRLTKNKRTGNSTTSTPKILRFPQDARRDGQEIDAVTVYADHTHAVASIMAMK